MVKKMQSYDCTKQGAIFLFVLSGMNGKNPFENIFDQILGTKLREHRNRLNHTQKSAVEKSGGHRQWLGKLESGKTTPSVFVLYKYTSAAGIDLSEVIKELHKDYHAQVASYQKACDQEKYKDYIQRIKKRKK